MIRNSNDEAKFPDKLLLTNTQVFRLHKPLANISLANIKTQVSKLIQSGGYLLHLANTAKTIAEVINKVQGLASKMSDDKFNKMVNAANVFLKNRTNANKQ